MNFYMRSLMVASVLTSPSAFANEIEPNNTKSAAVNMALGSGMIGNLNNRKDIDFYKLTTTTGGLLNIQFDRSNAPADGYYFYIYDSQDNLQVEYNLQNDASFKLPISVAGDYYIKVVASTPGSSSGFGANWSSDPYTITTTLDYTQGAAYDGETTDVRSAAITSTLDNPIIGSLNRHNDVDFYKITTATAGVLTLQFDRSDAKNDGYDIYLYDANNNFQDDYSIQTDRTVKFSVSSAGDYYLKVVASTPGSSSGFNANWSADTYTIIPSLEYTAGTVYDGETSDLLSAALDSSLGKPIIGNLNNFDDKDFYKLITPTAGILNIQFDRSDDIKDGYLLNLYNINSQLQGSFSVKADGTAKVPVDSAGAYYIRVSAITPGSSSGINSNWSYDLYSLTPTLDYTLGIIYNGENTDLFSSATAVGLGQTAVGASTTSTDSDYYKVTATTDGQLNMVFNRSDALTDGYTLSVYDSAAKSLGSATVNKDDTITAQISLAGDYYIGIKPANKNSWSLDPYSLSVTVGPINYVPTSTDKSITASEDSTYVFTANDFGFDDADSGDYLHTVQIISLPTRGDLTHNGAPITIGQSISLTELNNQTLAYAPEANENGDNYAGFDFKVSDGKAFSASYHININVTPMDEEKLGSPENDDLQADSDTGIVIKGLGGNDKLTGLGGDDQLFGGEGKDNLMGGSGNDLLDGGAKNDKMQGGLGDDTYVVDNTKDVVIESADAGADTIRSSINLILPKNVETLDLIDGSSAKSGAGNNLNNSLFGNQLANKLNGAAGDDMILGGAGNDSLLGGKGNDNLIGDAGNDILDGGSGDDTFGFAPGAGRDVIKNFGDKAGNQDVINLSDFNTSFEHLQFAVSGKNTVITINGIDSNDLQITLFGVKSSNLGEDDFSF